VKGCSKAAPRLRICVVEKIFVPCHMLLPPRLVLALAAVLFSTGAVALKSLSIEALPRACMRSGIAACFLFLLLPNARRLPRPRTWLLACGFAISTTSTVMAVSHATAATALFLQAMSPGLVLLGGALFLGERMRRLDAVPLCLIAMGFACLWSAPSVASATAPDPELGLAFACLSCVAWASTVLGLRRAASNATDGEDPSQQAIAYGNSIACLVTMAFSWPLPALGQGDVLVLAYLGIVQIGTAYALLVRGLRRVPAFQASLLLLLEPILTPVWTYFVHGEEPHSLVVLGGALALSGSAFHSLVSWLRAEKTVTDR
jgi:DME family drug/metabolite transporter